MAAHSTHPRRTAGFRTRRPYESPDHNPRVVSSSPNLPHALLRFFGPGQQILQRVVDARGVEIRLALERLPDVVHAVRVAVAELDDGQDEVVRLVQRVEDLVARDGDGLGVAPAPLTSMNGRVPVAGTRLSMS